LTKTAQKWAAQIQWRPTKAKKVAGDPPVPIASAAYRIGIGINKYALRVYITQNYIRSDTLTLLMALAFILAALLSSAREYQQICSK